MDQHAARPPTELVSPATVSVFVERLTTLDFSYVCAEHGLSGQTWIADLELTGQLGPEGMVLDFGNIKSEIKADLEALWDHKLVVPLDMPNLQFHEDVTNETITWVDTKARQWRHVGPKISTYTITTSELCIQTMIEVAQQTLAQKWQTKGIATLKLHLYEEKGDGAFFQYSHGLRLHKGACQRIAHGHRSQVQVYCGSPEQYNLNPVIAQQLAVLFSHSYLLDRSNVISQQNGQIILGYTAPEGDFELEVPSSRATMLAKETTIEHIAEFMLALARAEFGPQVVRIKVFEGFHKGAIALHRSTR